MYDFLSFKTFITPTVLIFFYYIGAIVIPIVLYYYKRKIFKLLGINITINWKVKLLFVAMFFFMELLWRMLFEMLIGYFQMHNALMQLV